MVIHKMYAYSLISLVTFTWITQAASQFREDYACFISILDLSCQEDEVLVFEKARYGRNDSSIAQRCQTHFYRNCDIDVTLTLHRNCAGRRQCQLHVNTKLFGDPCGYEEFLIVRYQCVQNSMVSGECPDMRGPPLYDHGYLASPNYPDKYYRDASCEWQLAVQQRQTIRITIHDFELDVKRNGRCIDYVEISSGDKVYFKDCGAQVGQKIDVDTTQALVRFNTDLSSMTERGFFIYFEAIGPGCRDLDDIHLGQATYFMEDDTLFANVTCSYGYVFEGTTVDFMQLKCLGNYWNDTMDECVAVPPPTSPASIPSLTDKGLDVVQDKTTATMVDEDSSFVFLISIVLGIISAMLLLSLLLIIILYYKKSRRRRRQDKMDQWRVVVNNLQENELNEINDDNWKRYDDSDGDFSPSCNITKAKRKNKQNNYADSPAGKKLMYGRDDDEYTLDYSDVHETAAKCVYDDPIYKNTPSRRNSKASLHKHALQRQRSGDRILDHPDGATNKNDSMCTECGNRTPKAKKRRPQSQRDLRFKRVRSGHCVNNRSAAQTPCTDAEVPIYGFPRQLTQSAPDLMQLECPPVSWAISPDQPYGAPMVAPPSSVQNTPHHSALVPDEDNRRATIGAPSRAKRALHYVPADYYEDMRC